MLNWNAIDLGGAETFSEFALKERKRITVVTLICFTSFLPVLVWPGLLGPAALYEAKGIALVGVIGPPVFLAALYRKFMSLKTKEGEV